MKGKRKRKELFKMRKQQERLMRKLVLENNEKILNERRYFGIYDKMGNLTDN